MLTDEHPAITHACEEPQDEVSDAVLSAPSGSEYSESTRRKRVSWSQERTDQLSGGSAIRHIAPVVPGTLRHMSSSATTLLTSRGRPLRRDEETEEDVVDEEGGMLPEPVGGMSEWFCWVWA